MQTTQIDNSIALQKHVNQYGGQYLILPPKSEWNKLEAFWKDPAPQLSHDKKALQVKFEIVKKCYDVHQMKIHDKVIKVIDRKFDKNNSTPIRAGEFSAVLDCSFFELMLRIEHLDSVTVPHALV